MYARNKYGAMNVHYCNDKLTVWFDDMHDKELQLIVPSHWEHRVVRALRRKDPMQIHLMLDALDVVQ